MRANRVPSAHPCPCQDPHQAPVPADDVDAAQWFAVDQLRGLKGAGICSEWATTAGSLRAQVRPSPKGPNRPSALLSPADLVVHCDRVAERAVRQYTIQH